MMDNYSTPEIRGDRVKAIRSGLNLSRQKFADIMGFKKSTLQNWEEGRHTGLTKNGARNLVIALSKHNVQVSVDWLLSGRGLPPIFPRTLIEKTTAPMFIATDHLKQTIQQELLLFHHLNKGSIDLLVADNEMQPLYMKGDIVAGKRFFGDTILNAVDHDCIVQTESGELLLRHLVKNTNKAYYDLYKYNSCLEKILTHQEIKLFSAAPVVWIRRKDT